MPAILAIVAQVLALLPSLVVTGQSIQALAEQTIAAINSGSTDPTDAQWAALDATVQQLQAQLDA